MANPEMSFSPSPEVKEKIEAQAKRWNIKPATAARVIVERWFEGRGQEESDRNPGAVT